MTTETIEPELNSLRAKLAIEIANDQREIEIRRRRIEKNSALLNAVKGSLSELHPERSIAGYGSKVDMIRDAILRLPTQRFTQDNIEAEIRKQNPEVELDRNRVRAAIWSLCKKHKAIKLINKGSNRQPAEFERIEGAIRPKRSTEQHKEQTLKNDQVDSSTNNGTHKSGAPISPSAFEDAVRAKSGRIKHLAERLGAEESAIVSLLEPTSKVYASVGGWLRLRE